MAAKKAFESLGGAELIAAAVETLNPPAPDSRSGYSREWCQWRAQDLPYFMSSWEDARPNLSKCILSKISSHRR